MDNFKEYFPMSTMTIKSQIEKCVKQEIVMKYELVNLIPNGDAFILQWEKRIIPLTQTDYEGLYL